MPSEATRESRSYRAGLRLMRLPGERGPILRCSGELSVATVEALRRELFLLASLRYPALTLNLSDCTLLDLDGILTILQTARQLQEEGRDLMLVAGSATVTRNSDVETLRLLPVFSTEAEAAATLRGSRSARGDRRAATKGQDRISRAIETLEATRRSEARREAAFNTSAGA
jgi:anti-anti-sigma factor